MVNKKTTKKKVTKAKPSGKKPVKKPVRRKKSVKPKVNKTKTMTQKEIAKAKAKMMAEIKKAKQKLSKAERDIKGFVSREVEEGHEGMERVRKQTQDILRNKLTQSVISGIIEYNLVYMHGGLNATRTDGTSDGMDGKRLQGEVTETCC